MHTGMENHVHIQTQQLLGSGLGKVGNAEALDAKVGNCYSSTYYTVILDIFKYNY